ncbi:UDP-N-acetylmuramoyl-tripeptide--D-alanyl-D-alanine ligase [Ornithinicoccus hortensis]|uniref:UDP-N-acetylmuramoyl-tripeptide--D-alanyl-D-alanine ligase n=1 Tax=Ornithinicoccus hortensis TaxID=82346 RepID=A0A542YRI4_9MICO|nr:UDP-N-acetylmuramoyl-tripeptide--D-alanyl-D-alanine ligase [Ornithinicoccus hortensis]TQL50534.1 UDP-N-acetylmuramoyl-tripeptide--D-alanyl-D-alanine ligase [Ornithinicoccus hortensis]
MIPLSLHEVAAVTGGRVFPAGSGDVLVRTAVVTDSREADPGSLYVARQGEHADGHDFVAGAAERGAVAALTDREVSELPCVVTPDVQQAFADLGREVVDRCTAAGGLRIIGITGSSGKTSTKDLMAQVVAGLGETVAPIASYNSEVGVPLTVCRLVESTAYLVAEMGASGVGHIEYLTRIAPPSIGVVLNVGTAHLGEFGSRQAIADTKAELVRALPADGLAVLNADDAVVAAMAEKTSARVLLVGTGPDAQVRAEDIRVDARGRAGFRLLLPGAEPQDVQLRLHGPHHVGNALSVAAVAQELGMEAPEIARALGEAGPVSRWRMEVHELPGGITLVNDAYNANPDSMRAALRSLASMRGTGRTFAVVGEMRELGEDSAAEHRAVGELAAQLGIDAVVTVGPGALPVAEGFESAGATRPGGPGAVFRTEDADAARTLLEQELGEGDVALLKSSRDSGLRLLGDAIVEAAEASD